MTIKRIFVILVALSVVTTVVVRAQPTTYKEFFGGYVTKRVNRIQEDANQLETLVDSWSNDRISQSAAVAKLEEMETRANRHFEDVLRLAPPEGEFQKYSQSIYIFVTWYNIIGMFSDGITDLDQDKLDAVSILSNHFEKNIKSFQNSLDQSG